MKLKLIFLSLLILLAISLYTNSLLLLSLVVFMKIVLILFYFMDLKECDQMIKIGLLFFFCLGTGLIIFL